MPCDRSCLANATPELAVFASAFAAMLWAALLILPGDSLATVEFRYMYAVGGDALWALAFFLVACLQLYRLLARYQTESLRIVEAMHLSVTFTAAMLWTFVTCLCFVSVWPPSPYAGTTGVLAAGMWWDFLAYDSSRLHHKRASQAQDAAPTRKAA